MAYSHVLLGKCKYKLMRYCYRVTGIVFNSVTSNAQKVEGPTSFWVSWFYDRLLEQSEFISLSQNNDILVTGKWPHMHPASFDYYGK